MIPAFRNKIIEHVMALRKEGRIIQGYYCDEEYKKFCVVGAISDYLRSLTGELPEKWEKQGNYDNHKKICALVTGLDVNALLAMDVIFEHYDNLSDEDFNNTLLLMRNVDWNIPKIYSSMIRTIYINMYEEAGLVCPIEKYKHAKEVTWESWPEIRGELKRNLPKGFMHEFDYWMIDTLLNPKEMSFERILALYLKGDYTPAAQVLQKLKSHTRWDPNGER